MTYKLSVEEKNEMLEDAKDIKRRDDFRKVRGQMKRMPIDEYIHWLTQLQKLIPERLNRKPVVYKKVLI